MGFGLSIFPILVVMGALRLPRADRPPLYAVTTVFFAAVSVLSLVLAYLERPVESSIAILTVLAGIPFYAAFASARARTDAMIKEKAS
jgi:APA family basic amino acid/polyamine antiporter